ncbi:MAG: flagellar biosynthetic protein FliQ [Ilumatobacteraceae bacterium]
MNSQSIIDICTQGLIVCAKVAGPFLGMVLAVGVIIGVLQSVTQLQEPTLSFVPKLVGAGLIIVLAGNWMLGELLDFARQVITSAPGIVGG